MALEKEKNIKRERNIYGSTQIALAMKMLYLRKQSISYLQAIGWMFTLNSLMEPTLR